MTPKKNSGDENQMTGSRYLLSFTGAGFLLSESVTIASLYQKTGNWEDLRKQVQENNLLQTRTNKTSGNRLREIVSRLVLLTEQQLALLTTGTRTEQNLLLWLAICRRYQYICDFAVEIIHEKFLRMDLDLTKKEYDLFFYTKAEWHEELENLTDLTRKKVRQVLFKMMRDAEILTSYNTINPALLTPGLASVLLKDRSFEHAVFPVNIRAVKEQAS